MQNCPRQLAMQSCVLCSFVRCGSSNQIEEKKKEKSIAGESDMDERVKDLCCSGDEDAQVIDNKETIFFKDLANILETEAVEGPPVNDKLAEVFNGICTKTFKQRENC